MSTNVTGKTQPDAYFDLVQQFPLTTIRDDEHLEAAIAFGNSLADGELEIGGREYLDALCTLIESYEANLAGCDRASPADILRHLMLANGHSQAELCEQASISKSLLSEILSGGREITTKTAKKLASVYGVGAGVFVN